MRALNVAKNKHTPWQGIILSKSQLATSRASFFIVLHSLLENIDHEDQSDSLSVEGDQVPRKPFVKGGPWTKSAGSQEPWNGFRLGKLRECQKQLGLILDWDDLFSGRKIEKEVRVYHNLRLRM